MVKYSVVTSSPDIAEIHSAIAALQELTELFQKRRSQLAEGAGLTEHQWGILEEISTEHFMPSMFARRRESSAAAVSKTIRQLVEKELVEVSPNKTDGRQRDYQLSAKGKRVMARLRRARESAIDQVWQKLNPEQVKQFNAFATDLSTRLKALIARHN